MLQSPHDAEDITQEVLLQIYRSLPDCRLDGLKTWITRIAVNRAIDFKRSRARRPEELTDSEAISGKMHEDFAAMPAAELLLYLKFSSSERAIVRYDWISVFFVGAIGTASLGLALLMSTGLFNELQRGLQMTQRSAFVDTKAVQVPAEINKIVVHSFGGVEFGETDTREVQLLGQVRYWSAEKLDSLDDKMLQTNIVGTTMYVMIGSADRRDGGFISDTIDPQLTLVIPKGVELVERGR